MNADGSPGVAVDVAVGRKTGALLPIGLGIAGVAVVLLAGGAALLVLGSRTPGQGMTPARPAPLQIPTPVS
jgi:hypothetical protein